MSVEAVREASARRLEAKRLEREAVDALWASLREASAAGASERELVEASGLTRQRVWQIVKGA